MQLVALLPPTDITIVIMCVCVCVCIIGVVLPIFESYSDGSDSEWKSSHHLFS